MTTTQETVNLDFYPCPCCGVKTVAKQFVFDICPVCGWEDDWDQSDLSANHMSLEEAQNRYQQTRCCKEREADVTEEQWELAVDLDLVWVRREDGEFGCVSDWKQQVRTMIPPH